MDIETRMIELIVQSGEARSCSMEALRASRKGAWEQVDQLLKMASMAMRKAQSIQSEFIGGNNKDKEKISLDLIVVHAQDHLMNAMLCRELTEEIIALRKELYDAKIK
ncbi:MULTISPECIES: PTS lactose/cellobiose transporter subunit IIA [unclassified Brenneria]|uniref:PTS lactose/cellobiose transporter subunit IIA n=1 Tax=unclassified Brenneria TaxID=2634434 RepID=UPI001552AD94|nr:MULTISPECIES: PTS lactose/cellobiose transporter subunit IIA [unclassified Brenneria]MBJ7221477.1 PTS lactose/cellobiose transporter subunit IIA [Brenneria sp. L3-3C-1]MEE3642719.1 PTS lactose/cellobiose transporter subunit IIA [Brenneria sp. L3_3C_1]MEE3652644.1 PTS lactose/cellobiose transporter subunit IIA [Brenneria sp. HEZEL_4_2_4]NPD02602.1 PTS lactose/cellobiose transporter subunit IIA [Brenneria sp. hezel4-2-4]